MSEVKLSFGTTTPYRAHTVATAYGVPTQPTEDGLGQQWVYLFTNQDLLDVEKADQLELVETIVHRFNNFNALLASAKIVMAGLEARIDRASENAVPVFNGIADLHDAIAAAEGEA